jgi:hypothetical protein
MNRIKL